MKYGNRPLKYENRTVYRNTKIKRLIYILSIPIPVSYTHLWVYSSAKRADIQLRCFEYRESRSGKWARTFLEGFSGVLITDGYV